MKARELWIKAMQLPSGVFDGRNPHFGTKYIRFIEYVQGSGFESPGPFSRRYTLADFEERIRQLYNLNNIPEVEKKVSEEKK